MLPALVRKWLNRPKRSDTRLLAQFFYADEDVTRVVSELHCLEMQKDPQHYLSLLNQLHSTQERMLTLIAQISEQCIPQQLHRREYQVKFPDELLNDNMNTHVLFAAELLVSGTYIEVDEADGIMLSPLAREVLYSLEELRTLLREQSLTDPSTYTESIHKALIQFDALSAEFELRYVSLVVSVKTPEEIFKQQEIVVLFCETITRALKLGYLTQDMIDVCEPQLMFTIPRLSIISGLLIYPDGPLNLQRRREDMSKLFSPFYGLLKKIRDLLYVLSEEELFALEKSLCSTDSDDPQSNLTGFDSPQPETIDLNPQPHLASLVFQNDSSILVDPQSDLTSFAECSEPRRSSMPPATTAELQERWQCDGSSQSTDFGMSQHSSSLWSRQVVATSCVSVFTNSEILAPKTFDKNLGEVQRTMLNPTEWETSPPVMSQCIPYFHKHGDEGFTCSAPCYSELLVHAGASQSHPGATEDSAVPTNQNTLPEVLSIVHHWSPQMSSSKTHNEVPVLPPSHRGDTKEPFYTKHDTSTQNSDSQILHKNPLFYTTCHNTSKLLHHCSFSSRSCTMHSMDTQNMGSSQSLTNTRALTDVDSKKKTRVQESSLCHGDTRDSGSWLPHNSCSPVYQGLHQVSDYPMLCGASQDTTYLEHSEIPQSLASRSSVPQGTEPSMHNSAPRGCAFRMHQGVSQVSASLMDQEVPQTTASPMYQGVSHVFASTMLRGVPQNSAFQMHHKVPQDSASPVHHNIPQDSASSMHHEVPQHSTSPMHHEVPWDSASTMHHKVPQDSASPMHHNSHQDSASPMHHEVPRHSTSPMHHNIHQDSASPIHHKVPQDSVSPMYQKPPQDSASQMHLKVPQDCSSPMHHSVPQDSTSTMHQVVPQVSTSPMPLEIPLDSAPPMHHKVPRDSGSPVHYLVPQDSASTMQQVVLQVSASPMHHKVPPDSASTMHQGVSHVSASQMHHKVPQDSASLVHHKVPQDSASLMQHWVHQDSASQMLHGVHQNCVSQTLQGMPQDCASPMHHTVPLDRASTLHNHVPQDRTLSMHHGVHHNTSIQHGVPQDSASSIHHCTPQKSAFSMHHGVAQDSASLMNHWEPQDSAASVHHGVLQNCASPIQQGVPQDCASSMPPPLSQDCTSPIQHGVPQDSISAIYHGKTPDSPSAKQYGILQDSAPTMHHGESLNTSYLNHSMVSQDCVFQMHNRMPQHSASPMYRTVLQVFTSPEHCRFPQGLISTINHRDLVDYPLLLHRCGSNLDVPEHFARGAAFTISVGPPIAAATSGPPQTHLWMGDSCVVDNFSNLERAMLSGSSWVPGLTVADSGNFNLFRPATFPAQDIMRSSVCSDTALEQCQTMGPQSRTISPFSRYQQQNSQHTDELSRRGLQEDRKLMRREIRLRYRSTSDMLHRLFVCIAGVADQLQTNFASDLRPILKTVFEIAASKPDACEISDASQNEIRTPDFERRPGKQLEDCALCLDINLLRAEDGECVPYTNDPPEWVPDSASSNCMDCRAPFTLVRRRHHCRSCGKIFCSRCSAHMVPLPHFGHSKAVRVCNHCFTTHLYSRPEAML